jgi:small subunit ribosomal protein S18
MADFQRFGSNPPSSGNNLKIAKKSTTEVVYVDYKNAEDLRRLLTPNGKILSRKRTGIGAAEQRLVSTAIKRARFMALLPYTSATV